MRVLLEELPSGRIIQPDLPVVSCELTRKLNAPGVAKFEIPQSRAVPIESLKEWGAALWVEEGSRIIGGGIITIPPEFSEGKIAVECDGVTAYLSEQPWQTKPFYGVKVDPLDMARKIWDHLQSLPNGNLRVTLDPTKSPVRIGEEERHVEFTTTSGESVGFDAGPFKLEPWSTNDLGQIFRKLATDTPFDYLEQTSLDGSQVRHHVQLGYPSLGMRRDDLTLAVGENAYAWPEGEDGAPFANAVTVWGAGEGEKMIRSDVIFDATSTRLRRARAVTDKKAQSNTAASAAAARALKHHTGGRVVTGAQVMDHSRAPLARLSPGDWLRVIGAGALDGWARITEITRNPASATAKLKMEGIPQ